MAWHFGLIGAGIGAMIVGAAGCRVLGWFGMVAGVVVGHVIGRAAFAIMYLTASIFQ